MIEAAETWGKQVGVAEACRVLAVPRSSLYEARKPKSEPAPRPTPPRALSAEERARIREIANSERFCDSDPRTIYATLLDEGVYWCDWRTIYRILEEHDEVQERRPQRRAVKRIKPQLRATQPNQVWSWDITQLKGPQRIFYLYTIIDVYSRYVIGFGGHQSVIECGQVLHDFRNPAPDSLARNIENALQATHTGAFLVSPHNGILFCLIVDVLRFQNSVDAAILTMVLWTATLVGSISDDVFAAADAATISYGLLDHPWIVHHHLLLTTTHSGLALLTPATVHHGEVEAVVDQRQRALDEADDMNTFLPKFEPELSKSP